MSELSFGDICLCDLSLSLDSRKEGIAPMMFLSKETDCSGNRIIRMCRIAKLPNGPTRHPFADLGPDPALRYESAVFPTQTVIFPENTGITRILGSVSDPKVIAKINEIRYMDKRRKKDVIVMTLCQRCRSNFLEDPELFVWRVDPFSQELSQCDFCQTRNGYTYRIYRRKLYGGKRSK